MRVTSAFFVSAFMRKAANAGAFPILDAKGAEEAGAIFIRIDISRDQSLLYTPAPMSAYGEGDAHRKFEAFNAGTATDVETINMKLAREREIDPDIWIVSVDDREGRCFLEVDQLA